MTRYDWFEKGRFLFGDDQMKWKFVCPSCGYVASVQEWKDVGASVGQVAFSCIGRYMEEAKEIFGKPGPCNYAGGGLIGLNPVVVDGIGYFSFYDGEKETATERGCEVIGNIFDNPGLMED